MLLGTNTNSHVLSPVQELARGVWDKDNVLSPGDATYHIIINSLRDHSPCTPPLIFAAHPPIAPPPICLTIPPSSSSSSTSTLTTRDVVSSFPSRPTLRKLQRSGDGVAASHPRTPRLVRNHHPAHRRVLPVAAGGVRGGLARVASGSVNREPRQRRRS